MKKLLIFVGLFFIFSVSYSQVFVNGININEQKSNYCIIKQSGFYRISVNYGQEKPNKKAEISDKSGKRISTKNIVTILNFMGQNGWILISCSLPDINSPMWVFRKKQIEK
ncbi:MAG: hypothetical protein GXO80_02530 [Chlorobi bacterium]|nr:hypothetical protein [Chlorobiota bacterium]